VASLGDVAHRAQVSVATVSRVLSGSSHPVRNVTRERVLQAATELDFRPNALAKGLVTTRTNIIGAIVHDISDPYFAEMVRGLEDAANATGYQVFVCSSDRDPDRELTYVRTLLSYRVDAIVLAGGVIEDRSYQRELSRLLAGFEEEGGAVVTLAPHSHRASGVILENREGAASMTHHLLALGHRRIGFVAGPPQIRSSRLRLAGYRQALEAFGLTYDEQLLATGWFTPSGGAAAVCELLDRAPDLTAILASSDAMAFGVLKELADRGIAVPEDISVAGFDDVQMAAYVQPPLTTVRIPTYALGNAGAEIAFEILAGGNPRPRRLPLPIVERASTGPAKAS
jgi:LacI family transcriptional regulator, galactose operon repressor